MRYRFVYTKAQVKFDLSEKMNLRFFRLISNYENGKNVEANVCVLFFNETVVTFQNDLETALSSVLLPLFFAVCV